MAITFTVDSDRINVSGSLDTRPPDTSGRWRLAVIGRDATLGGADFLIYSSSASAKEDLDASSLDQASYDAIVAAFANGAPDVAVIGWDETGAEPLADALDAALLGGLPWYWTHLPNALDSETVIIDGWIADKRKQQIQACETVGAWTSGGATVPAPINAIDTSQKTSILVYDQASEYPAAAVMGKYSAVNLDRQALGAVVSIQGSPAQGLTDTEAADAFLKNANVAELNRELSPSAVTFYKGTTLSGEYIEAINTLHWTEYAIEDALSALFARYDASAIRPPRVSAPWVGAVNSVGEAGLAAGHFRITPELPKGYRSSAVYNSGTGCMDVTVEYGYADGVRCASVSFNLTREG